MTESARPVRSSSRVRPCSASAPRPAEADLRGGLEVAAGNLSHVASRAEYALGVILRQHDPAAAAELLQRASSQLRQIGDVGCLNACNRALADLACSSGDDDNALDLLQDTMWLMPDVDQQEAASLVQIGEIYLRRGYVWQACALASAAEPLARGSGIGWNARQRLTHRPRQRRCRRRCPGGR